MKQRQWIIRRSTIQKTDAQFRWNRAYQSLVQWSVASTAERSQSPRVQKEDNHESRDVCAGLHPSAQALTQTIEQQIQLLYEQSQAHGWPWCEDHLFRDDGYSGTSLRRPGLDRLRDQVRSAAFDRVVITAPDRLIP
jgi:hypothetical protein